MTKRSVTLVGVLVLIVALGSMAIGVISSRAATESDTGPTALFLPLVMKFFAPLAATDIYMAGNIESSTGGFAYALPVGYSNSNVNLDQRTIISPPQDCIAQDLRAEIVPHAGTTYDAGYELELDIEYIGGPGEFMSCLIADPETTCVSTAQLTIPANSMLYIRVRSLKINYGRAQIPFAWICSP